MPTAISWCAPEIPSLIPRHVGRLALDYQLTPRWDAGGTAIVAAGSYLHGNENNANQAGGTNGAGAFIAGSGWIPGYVVVNLRSTYRLTPQLELFARLVNLFDRDYATAGFLTTSSFTAAGRFIANPADWTNQNAVAPAEPRAVWVGVRVRLHEAPRRTAVRARRYRPQWHPGPRSADEKCRQLGDALHQGIAGQRARIRTFVVAVGYAHDGHARRPRRADVDQRITDHQRLRGAHLQALARQQQRLRIGLACRRSPCAPTTASIH